MAGMLQKIVDGLANLMTGGGTTIDRRKHNRWLQNALLQHEVEDAYRGSWLMRKIIDLPAEDMTRAWRSWQGDDAQITALEEEEERLRVRERVLQGLTLGRLGGGLLVMGFADTPSDELDVERIGKGDLQYLYPVSRWDVKPGDPVTDPTNPQFGEPELFEIKINSETIDVHHSRVIVFKGQFSGNLSTHGRTEFWGDSVVTAVNEAVENATSIHNEFSSLIKEAKIDLYKIPDLMNNVGNTEYEQRFLRRLELANLGKSNHRALIMDAAEEWEQRQLTIAGWAELMLAYMSIVAGAADIPATRLLGKSPDGMNATGESDQDNYEQMVKAKQNNDLRPLLKKLDEALIRSALGSRPEELYFEFRDLSIPDAKEAAEVEKSEAETLNTLVGTGLFQDEALEQAFSTRMIESGRWPGYEEARKKAIEEAERNPTPEDIEGVTVPGAPGQEGDGGSPSTGPGSQAGPAAST